jgi:NADPH2:quinone reductase
VEVVGTVVGEGGQGLPAGVRVACSTPPGRFGGFAEYAAVPSAEAVVLDEAIPAGVALALRGNYPTSLYALRHGGRLAKGETLLVHAGAGGVGSAAVQLGKRMGARVIATACGASKLEACRLLGADVSIDYTLPNWLDEVRGIAPDGIDVIYDPVGGETGIQSMRCLAFGARYLVIGFAGGVLTQLPANRLLLQNASAVGVLWGAIRKRDPALSARLTDEVYAAYGAGELEPLKAPAFRFDKAPEALAALERRQTAGKAVLLIGPVVG